MGINEIPPLLLIMVFSFLVIFSLAQQSQPQLQPQQQLSKDYYKNVCPRFSEIINQQVTSKQTSAPTTAAAMLRVFFHDCMVDGCDGSTLVASNSFHGQAERDADVNLSLPGDAFDLVTRVKTALELECPGVVSCADILAICARNLVMMTGGPHFELLLGRKDGLISQASRVFGNLALPNMTVTQHIELFKRKGFTVQEMVALVGGHTIGFSHCNQFSNRLFNYSKTQQSDPKMNPKLVEGLRMLCANYTKDPAMAAFNDVMTPGKFDNMYYRNLKRGLGLLASDQALFDDPRTKPFVELYASNETAFFNDFSKAMQKVSMVDVKVGNQGEVRHRCDQFNNVVA